MTVEAASVKVVQPEQVARRRPERLRKRTDRSRLASVGLHGALVVASLIAVFPVFWVLVTSFKPDAKAVETTPKLVNDSSLDNYVRILAGDKGDFLAWFGNSVLIALMTTVLAVFLSATTGYAASRFRFPGKRSLMLSFLVVQMFPFAVLIVPLYNILLVLGLQGTSMGLVLVYCTTAVPFCTYMLKGYFDTIPNDIDEAGRVDGLSPFGVFWRLVLPLARPGLAVTAFYAFLTAWGEVAFASAFLSAADESKTLAVGLQVFVQQNRTEWGHLAAASILVAIPAIIVFYLVQRFLVTGLASGAVKG
ncbi:arabinogalactan oligomer/maltooligosaccharide transport system permease protein [Saccharothrix ecbatanensis]|jgi:arabinogalactan oligomer/maltooligosaccharide transport system permease protein|uniref:Arabinogalactan oligomer/maltooligosaccharide transport system permease protein n=1 Tax=Saccharothrix ecbatanensis TaxID=1105145 RepID=A0A7W9M4Q8_9PSEU|nr:carbohydrate ABC transporter permease [Saccharothrix ecbatanensis]MBB5807209.1 arabinogalactan oligomer/maltooligosaccharide transport system permease protein [Saccharothrix ecbatanensis]